MNNEKEMTFALSSGTLDYDQVFLELKNHLMKGPKLALSHLSCPLHLYIQEKIGTTLGMLTQKLGPLAHV